MEAYEAFASIYDAFMEEIDYDMWVAYLHKIWEKECFQPKLIVDLGCGTGNANFSKTRISYDRY